MRQHEQQCAVNSEVLTIFGRLLSEAYTVFTSTATYSITIQFLYGSNGIVGCRFNKKGATTEYSFIRNEKGDVTRVYNGNGELAGEYFYDAYGNCGTDGHC